jgi:hypothetical protein
MEETMTELSGTGKADFALKTEVANLKADLYVQLGGVDS